MNEDQKVKLMAVLEGMENQLTMEVLTAQLIVLQERVDAQSEMIALLGRMIVRLADRVNNAEGQCSTTT